MSSLGVGEGKKNEEVGATATHTQRPGPLAQAQSTVRDPSGWQREVKRTLSRREVWPKPGFSELKGVLFIYFRCLVGGYAPGASAVAALHLRTGELGGEGVCVCV